MNDETPRKPVGGSRAPAPAPRRIAGRGTRPVPSRDETAAATPPVGPPAPGGAPGPAGPPGPAGSPEPPAPPAPPPPPAADRGGRAAELLSHPRTTAVLCALVAGLLLVGLAELAYAKAPDSRVWFWQDDTAGAECEPVEVGADFRVPDRPIMVPLLEWRNANQVAADLTVKILNQDWKTYDEHVDEVAELATGTFAKEYPQTAEDTRERFLSNKAEYDFAVVGQSVVQACPVRMTSLLFLNQFVYKGEGRQRTGPDVFQVRVVVTTVREDGDWLVADLDAQ